MSDYPAWTSGTDAGQQDEVDVDWAALPADWRERNHRHRRAGETAAELANIVRAKVAEGLLPPENLSYADRLEG